MEPENGPERRGRFRTKDEPAAARPKDKEKDKVAEYAKGNPVVSQLIDLALLQNGMLKGAALDTFLKRSVELIK